MNILFIKHFFVGFMVSEIPRVSVFGICPYSVTFPYISTNILIIVFLYSYLTYFYIIYYIVYTFVNLFPIEYTCSCINIINCRLLIKLIYQLVISSDNNK